MNLFGSGSGYKIVAKSRVAQPPFPAPLPGTRAVRENRALLQEPCKLHRLQHVPEGTHLPQGKGS